MKLMICTNARGGMRSVVEAYKADPFWARQDIRLIHSHVDGNFVLKQWICLKALAQFLFLLITQKVELVHIHSAMRGSFWRKGLFLRIAHAFKVPTLFHLHGSEMKQFYASQGPNGKTRIRKTFEMASRVLVLSQGWKSFVGQVAPNANIIVLPNYVPDQTETPPSATPDRLNILFMGVIGPRKGTFDLINAMTTISQRFPQVQLTIGGNGQQAEAEALVTSLGLGDHVRLAGWVGPEDRAKLLQSADIFVLPSYNENLPMSLLEAMSYGVCVVSTTVGGIPELVHDSENGLLITPGDITALEAAFTDLIEHPDKRRKLAQKGRETQRSAHSDTVVIPFLDQIYAEVGGQKPQ